MTTPRDSGADSGRWWDEESPLIERHPGFDRYPPANTPARGSRTNEPEVPEFLAGHKPAHPADPPHASDEQAPRSTSRWSRRRRSEPTPSDRPEAPSTRPVASDHTSGPQAAPTTEFRGTPPPGARPSGTRPAPPTARYEAQPPARHDTPPPTPHEELEGRAGQARRQEPERGPAGRPEQPHPGNPETTRPLTHSHDLGAEQDDAPDPGLHKPPKKLTVTRVAARRSRELTERGFATFQRAAKADGAEESGLTALVYATMANFATDAAVGVALANTLFFASATAESKTKVALYLLITIAPFAVIAPLIGPALDRLQRGRRLTLAGSFAARVLVAILLIFNVNNWALYPLALCMMILSKSFSVLKSAVTPRVLPAGIDLVRTNSRLTVFGLVGGTMGAGGIAALIALVAHSAGALAFAAVLAGVGCYLSLKIPSWVEVTEGEVPATLTYHGDDSHTEVLGANQTTEVQPSRRRQPLGRAVVTGLWGNSTVRLLTGFLFFYVPFVAKSTEHEPAKLAAMLGVFGASAAIGNFAGNATGARMKLGRPTQLVLICTIACVAAGVIAAYLDSLMGAAIATLVASGASALAKVSLDASIQDDLPAESIASGFGRSETVLQLSWVIGGSMGVLLPTDWWIGFAAVTAVMALGLTQTVVSYRGHSLLPGLGGNRPQHAQQEIPGAHGTAEPTR
ncbi:MFS transporter [Nocardia sp.]|uniref:MFS transporter n=1 Tax=Nocardia sp. TaxID=1821 RepID=UPI002631B9DC|nr:MFS transporter [Nocardia sp.]